MFTIRLADINIQIDNRYKYVKYLCRDYVVKDKNFDFEVSVSYDDMINIKNESEEQTTLGYCEAIALYRKICNELLNYNRMFLHSSVVEVDDKCYCISAVSGTGKSTHTALWKEYFKDRARIINGDKPILELTENGLIAYGTPWCGKEGENINTSSRVKAICFLERAKVNSAEEISYKEAFRRIVEQLEYPRDKDKVNKLFDLLEKVLENTKFYLFKCNMDVSAVKVAYEKIISGGYMKLKDGLVVRKFKEDYVAIGSGKLVNEFSGHLIFNEVGKDILYTLRHDVNKEEMVNSLKEKYPSVSTKEIEDNIDAVLKLLRDCNLIEE